MVKLNRYVAALLIFLAVQLVVGIGVDASKPSSERRFEFTYAATLHDIPTGTKRLAVWIPYPTSDAHQDITDIHVSCSHPARVTDERTYRNRMLYVEWDRPEASSLDIEFSFNVDRREYVRRDLDDPKVTASSEDAAGERDLASDRLVPIDARTRRLAAQVTEGKATDLERARAIYDYVLANMKYDKSGTGWGNGDLLWACDAKRGNCTDFHALFIGLCRGAGIPARFSIGFPLPAERGEGTIAGYHCWAEFFVKGRGWIPVDASEAWKNSGRAAYYFGAVDENRVQFRRGRDITLNPRQAGPPLNYFIYPYAEVDGVAFNQLTKRFTFRDREIN